MKKAILLLLLLLTLTTFTTTANNSLRGIGDPKTIETKSDDREHSALGDGCYHIFIDAGSNRGVHGRFLFEPEKYPKSKFATKFDEIYGNNRTKKEICVFAFEPNPMHNTSQMAIQEAYQKMGWRYHYMPYGVSDHNGALTFYRILDQADKDAEEWGFAMKQNVFATSSQPILVDVIDLALWTEKHIFNRIIPPPNEYHRGANPVVAMKMDVEGSEWRTIDHMLEMQTACKFDYILGELHYSSVVPQTFGHHNLTEVLHVIDYAQYMKGELAKEGCPSFQDFDDEEYLHDGMPYPTYSESH